MIDRQAEREELERLRERRVSVPLWAIRRLLGHGKTARFGSAARGAWEAARREAEASIAIPPGEAAILAAELRELIPQMREDAQCHATWTTDEAQRDLEPGSAYLERHPPRDIAGDRAWHERWAAFYTKVADTMEQAANVLASVATAAPEC